jgi:hypothetical protein
LSELTGHLTFSQHSSWPDVLDFRIDNSGLLSNIFLFLVWSWLSEPHQQMCPLHLGRVVAGVVGLLGCCYSGYSDSMTTVRYPVDLDFDSFAAVGRYSL